MKKWTVTVARRVCEYTSVEVEAESEGEAREKAESKVLRDRQDWDRGDNYIYPEDLSVVEAECEDNGEFVSSMLGGDA